MDWSDEAILNGVRQTVRIVFVRDTEAITHGGTWDVRYDEACGRVTKEEADQCVRELRLLRRLNARRRQPP